MIKKLLINRIYKKLGASERLIMDKLVAKQRCRYKDLYIEKTSTDASTKAIIARINRIDKIISYNRAKRYYYIDFNFPIKTIIITSCIWLFLSFLLYMGYIPTRAYEKGYERAYQDDKYCLRSNDC